jgi:hypothetical protein
MTTDTNSAKPRRADGKPYQKPTLAKGPLLATVTAEPPVSATKTICWVARAAFGATDIRWMIFRAWLIEDAPAWFRRLYIRHGEAFGGWLGARPRARGAVRRLMMPAIRRKAGI